MSFDLGVLFKKDNIINNYDEIILNEIIKMLHIQKTGFYQKMKIREKREN